MFVVHVKDFIGCCPPDRCRAGEHIGLGGILPQCKTELHTTQIYRSPYTDFNGDLIFYTKAWLLQPTKLQYILNAYCILSVQCLICVH